jgi:Uncharacterized conserved protein
MNYWLMKSDPGEFSIDDLINAPNQTEHWDGVRNYQARNMMRDQMKKGDRAFFYHSACAEVGIVGSMKIVQEAYPDFTAFKPGDPHYDPKSDLNNPCWFMVDVRLIRKFKRTISLAELRQYPELQGLSLLQRGHRLSIMPVTKEQWAFILRLA